MTDKDKIVYINENAEISWNVSRSFGIQFAKKKLWYTVCL